MANSINDLSPNFRDLLLNRNLILSDTITNNGLSASAVGLGSIPSISSIANSVQPSDDLEESGINHRSNVISRNRYTSTEDMVAATIINNSYSYSQRDGGYIDENKDLNLGGNGTKSLDVIDSFLSQEGFGLGNDGFTSQGDIRTTLSGRVLGATGGINETPLGIIGGQQLLLALGQRATFNAQRELFGQVNLSPFSLLSGSEFLVPDNSITVRSTTAGRIGDIALDVFGFNLPIDIIDDNASIFTQNVETSMGEASLLRNNSLIKYTGKGQIIRLFDNLNANTYAPDYDSDGSGRKTSKLGVHAPREYKTTTSGVTLTGQIFDKNRNAYVPVNPVFDGSDSIWDPNVTISDDNTLLSKTKSIFKTPNNPNGKIDFRIFDDQGIPYGGNSQLITPHSLSNGKISKGSAVTGIKDNGESDNIFCRTWTSTKTYSSVADLQKNTGLFDYRDKIRNDTEDSVLGDNGFVKISPYRVPDSGSVDPYEAKKFMFSIENLAWNDQKDNLPKFEIGNGDPKTGTKGRIMWFPPYDIKFTDTTAVDWDSTKFIGRGEPVYTYNNTERSGTLSFKVIIDYPDYMNNSKISTDELMSSLVAGCTDYNEYFSQSEFNQLQEEINADINLEEEFPAPYINLPNDFNFYFPNDVATLLLDYEVPDGILTNPTISEGYTSEVGTPSSNSTNYGLNTWDDLDYIDSLREKMLENTGIRVKLKGFASLAGNSTSNKALSDARINAIEDWFRTNINSDIKFLKSVSNGDSQSSATGEVDSIVVKKDRAVMVQFEYQPQDDEQISNVTDIKKEPTNSAAKEIIRRVKNRFHREDEYFEKLKNSDINSDKIIYNNIREKIKFFHPAFHSTTPEGFNSRLTFLQQCTRQGPTNKGTKSNNLAFGAPPVCILRIGDFYHTKIIINSLGIEYDPLVWDLNPEGVGVQPMIANVNISFKFIGGSALNGPINKLQNAVSFNYFANSGVYDPRADRWVRKDKIDPTKPDELFDHLEGVTDLKDFAEEAYPPLKKQETSLRPEQKSVSEIAAKKGTELTIDTQNDRQILIDSFIGWIVTFDAAINNTFIFTYSVIEAEMLNLTDEYNVILEVIDADSSNGLSYKRVLSFKANSSTTDGAILAPDVWNESPYADYSSDKFRLTIKGGNIIPITDFGNWA
tara:strand:+ start:21188 stop:24643 length:3456 start_codon:yes stop_codon:yes gene_type:complete